ncbi:hypothetical protein J2W28_004302 [Variovorax boronicumulans]|uniref:hypothetical protein n=1 Tax=Variovorax boronicumulans TaxID=436515 RepID=UPI00277E6E50|nr:hypothetical protein [Variovorax boronicumulans]MDP9993997.1 hypothetical protein [Variovorax boronicumulans]MDQ0005140.1 hypothetical protein [Variovorax boronicumulans]
MKERQCIGIFAAPRKSGACNRPIALVAPHPITVEEPRLQDSHRPFDSLGVLPAHPSLREGHDQGLSFVGLTQNVKQIRRILALVPVLDAIALSKNERRRVSAPNHLRRLRPAMSTVTRCSPYQSRAVPTKGGRAADMPSPFNVSSPASTSPVSARNSTTT